METIKTTGWQDFLERLKPLRQAASQGQSYLLFRGQGNGCWQLRTTLERYTKNHPFLMNYFSEVLAIKPEVESQTEKAWPVDVQSLRELFQGINLIWTFMDSHVPAMNYLSYLRQHGFPSPLLDWSRSVYIAAFFAFRESVDGAESAAIYVLDTQKGQVKSTGFPNIFRLRDLNSGHRRHFIQQSEYTLCLSWQHIPETSFGEWQISEHDSGFEEGGKLQDSYKITKFLLPGSERQKVLQELADHNLNAFTLFGTDESLMEALAFRMLSS